VNKVDPRAFRARRTRALPVAIFVVVGVLAVIAAILAISVLTRAGGRATSSESPVPSATATIDPSPEVDPSPTASASPKGSDPASPSASPAATPVAGIPDGLLPAGSMVTVTGDGVRIRAEPSTDTEIVATMAAGDLVHVVDTIAAGPVTAEGYEWYRVAYRDGDDVWPWQDLAPDGIVYGWMAAGDDDERFVTLADVSCPAEPITLSDLAFRLTSWERLVCIGDTVTIEGTFGCDSCTDGVTPGADPPWLADVEQQPPIAGAYAYYPFIQVAIPPDVTPPENRDVVRATLRVDHPAASRCTYTPEPSDGAGDFTHDPMGALVFCRERLVLESFEVIGTDDFGR
jgi:hypothetical protein